MASEHRAVKEEGPKRCPECGMWLYREKYTEMDILRCKRCGYYRRAPKSSDGKHPK